MRFVAFRIFQAIGAKIKTAKDAVIGKSFPRREKPIAEFTPLKIYPCKSYMSICVSKIYYKKIYYFFL